MTPRRLLVPEDRYRNGDAAREAAVTSFVRAVTATVMGLTVPSRSGRGRLALRYS
jgi:hypothetical protein